MQTRSTPFPAAQSSAAMEALAFWNACPVPMYVLRREEGGGEFRLLRANDCFQALTGYSAQECGEPYFWIDGIHREDLPGVLAACRGLEAGAAGVEQEFRFRQRNGRLLRVRDRVALRRGSGPGLELVGAWIDVRGGSDDETCKQAASSREALYRSVIDASPDAFFVIDEQGRILEWSERAEALFGRRAKEVLGCNLEKSILLRSFREEPADAFGRFLLAAGARPGSRRRFAAQGRDGAELPVEIQLTPFSWGEAQGFTGFIRDISGQVLTEARLLQAQKSEAISQLTGGLAHDFNNILGIVIGGLEALALPIRPEEKDQLLKAARSAAGRGVEVIQSLLSVARRSALQSRDVDVNELLREMGPLIRQTAGKSITVEIAAVALDSVVRIDPGSFNNAILNLAINARDAMPKGGTLCIYTHRLDLVDNPDVAPEVAPGEYIAIGVDDTGCGMSATVSAMAFDPFFTTKARGKGTGLGLSTVYSFARQSGGTAQIHSVLGKGTLITVLLPVVAKSGHES